MRKTITIALLTVLLAATPAVAHHGHKGGEGNGGYGGTPSVSAPAVSAPAVSAPNGGALETFAPVSADGKGAREQTITDLQVCTAPPTPSAGLVSYDTKANGSFTYWGLEYATPDFVDCMNGKGYKMPTAGRSQLTNFGAR